MKKRLVFKLLPVALLAAIGIFLAAKEPPRTDAAITSLSPSIFTVNPGTPASFSFTADAAGVGGAISVSAVSAAAITLGATCTSCSVSGSGSALSITPPSGSVAFVVSLTLSASCVNSGTPVTLTVTQGTTMTATGVTGTCSVSCVNSFLSGCCDGTIFGSNCGCGFGTSSLLFGNSNCGCGFGTSSLLFGNSGCGCGFGTTSLLVAGCGCNGVGTFGSFGSFGNPLLNGNCGCQTLGSTVLVQGNLLSNCGTGVQSVAVTVPGSANCGSTTNVLVTVRNSIGGIAPDGTPVTIASSMGTISPASTRTVGGIATATLLLPAASSGTASITASSAGFTGQASIAVSCAVVPVAVVPVAPILPVLIAAPNTGDGGCSVIVCNGADWSSAD